MREHDEQKVLGKAQAHLKRLFPKRVGDLYVDTVYPRRNKTWSVPIKSRSVDLSVGNMVLDFRGTEVRWYSEEGFISRSISEQYASQQGIK